MAICFIGVIYACKPQDPSFAPDVQMHRGTADDLDLAKEALEKKAAERWSGVEGIHVAAEVAELPKNELERMLQILNEEIDSDGMQILGSDFLI